MGGTGGGGWCHLQGDMHIVAVEEPLLGSGEPPQSCPDYMDRLTKLYSHFVEGWLLARKATWTLRGVWKSRVLIRACSLMSGHG